MKYAQVDFGQIWVILGRSFDPVELWHTQIDPGNQSGVLENPQIDPPHFNFPEKTPKLTLGHFGQILGLPRFSFSKKSL